MRAVVAAAALLLLAGDARARCLYLGANSRIDNYVVLDLTDLSRVASFDAIGQPDAMLVRGDRLYINIIGPGSRQIRSQVATRGGYPGQIARGDETFTSV